MTIDTVSQEANVWEGFTYPEQDFFKMPNDFIDMLPLIDNVSELKVILYVMRHTWGFQEYEEPKKITMDEFINGRKLKSRERMDNGTGLAASSAQTGIAKAIKHGFLECVIDDSDLGRIKKSYRLKMKETTKEQQSQEDDKPQNGKDRLIELQTMPYSDYLKTPEWGRKRAKALRFAGYKCQLCNSPENLNVHHRTYERRGRELMGDLTVLCQDCHSTFTYNRNLAE